jgi:hypothetical protein
VLELRRQRAVFVHRHLELPHEHVGFHQDTPGQRLFRALEQIVLHVLARRLEPLSHGTLIPLLQAACFEELLQPLLRRHQLGLRNTPVTRVTRRHVNPRSSIQVVRGAALRQLAAQRGAAAWLGVWAPPAQASGSVDFEELYLVGAHEAHDPHVVAR